MCLSFTLSASHLQRIFSAAVSQQPLQFLKSCCSFTDYWTEQRQSEAFVSWSGTLHRNEVNKRIWKVLRWQQRGELKHNSCDSEGCQAPKAEMVHIFTLKKITSDSQNWKISNQWRRGRRTSLYVKLGMHLRGAEFKIGSVFFYSDKELRISFLRAPNQRSNYFRKLWNDREGVCVERTVERVTHPIRSEKLFLANRKKEKCNSSSFHEDLVKCLFKQLRHSLDHNLGTICLREINILCPESQFHKVFSSPAQHDPSSQRPFD